MRWQTPLILALLLSIWFAPRAQANSILNGGFEASGFADWIVQPGGSGSLVFEGGSAHTGHAAAWFGAVGAIADTISEVFSTNPGESYTATFWLAHPSSDHANSFTVLWDGLPILTLVNATRFGYTEYTFVEQAVGTLSTISFSGRDTLGFFELDDVSVSSAETPEPWTLVLFSSGLLGLLLPRSRRAFSYACARQSALVSR